MRLQVPLAITLIAGLLMFVQFFVPHEVGVKAYDIALRWVRIISAFALVLGIGSLIKTHLDRISRKREGWFYSVVTLASLAIMTFLGLWRKVEPGEPAYWVFRNVEIPLEATMFSMLAFFIASAAYRTFRARTPEATLLLVTAIIVMIGRVPIGAALHNVLGDSAEWIFSFPSTAAKRGILFGVALGSIATSLRIILGIERSYFGGEHDS